MNKWTPLVENEIWINREFLKPATLQFVNHVLSNSSFAPLRPNAGDIEGLRRAGVNATFYNYSVHHNKLRCVPTLIEEVFSQFEDITDIPMPRKNLHPLQFFSKSFQADSYYALHTEPSALYGPFAFVTFLTDEPDMELVFPGQSEIEEYCRKNPLDAEHWEKNCDLLRSHHTEVRIIGPVEIFPRKNSCVLFRTESAHFVNRSQSSNWTAPRRYSLTGWPYAKSTIIESLNQESPFDERFNP